MSLTPREMKKLAEIEEQLVKEDPRLERRLKGEGRIDWVRLLGPLASPWRFRATLALLILLGPAGLTVFGTAAGVAVGLVGYLAAIPLVMVRLQLRPVNIRSLMPEDEDHWLRGPGDSYYR